jgi:hypothetical protein
MTRKTSFLTLVCGNFAQKSIEKCPFSYFLSYNNVKTLEIGHKRRKQIKVFSRFSCHLQHYLIINVLDGDRYFRTCHPPVTHTINSFGVAKILW